MYLSQRHAWWTFQNAYFLLRTRVLLHLAQHRRDNMSEPVGALPLLLLCRCPSVFASPQRWHLVAQMCKGQKSKELASPSHCTGACGQGLKAVATVTTAWLLPPRGINMNGYIESRMVLCSIGTGGCEQNSNHHHRATEPLLSLKSDPVHRPKTMPLSPVPQKLLTE